MYMQKWIQDVGLLTNKITKNSEEHPAGNCNKAKNWLYEKILVEIMNWKFLYNFPNNLTMGKW